jgi:hypothetical protein
MRPDGERHGRHHSASKHSREHAADASPADSGERCKKRSQFGDVRNTFASRGAKRRRVPAARRGIPGTVAGIARRNQDSWRATPRNKAVFGPVLQLLDGLDIEFAAYVRTGPVVFSILDAAEELECDEIVVPAPGSALSHLLSRHVVTILTARQRSARLVAVTKSGIAVP